MKGLLIQFGIDLRLSFNILKQHFDIDRLVIDEIFPWTKILSTTEFFEGIKHQKDPKPFSSYHRVLPLYMIMYKNLKRDRDILFNLENELEAMGITELEYDIPKILEIREYVEGQLYVEHYDYIGFYTITRATLYMTLAMMLIKQKYPDKRIIGGGPWFEVECHNADMFIENGTLDGYLVGDIEGIDISEIKGRTVNFCKDINTLEMPEPTIQTMPWNNQDAIFFYGSKGCPFSCSFCQQGIQKFRAIEPKKVAAYLQRCFNETGFNSFFAADNIFFVHKSWILELRDEIKRLGLLGKINFPFCNVHPIYLSDRETLDAIEDLRIHLFIGAESFSTASLRRMKKGVTREYNLKMVDELRRRNISFTLGRVFQFPGETEDEFQESLDSFLRVFMWNKNSRYLGVFSLFPNTDVYDNHDRFNIRLNYFNSNVYNYMPEFNKYLDQVPCSYTDLTDPNSERFLKVNKKIRIINDKICKVFPL